MSSPPLITSPQETILRWRANPSQFVTEALGVTPEPWQHECLQALATEDKVSIRSGHGVGKSAVDSWAIIWFMTCFYPTKVPCSAPTMHQLKDVLWAELSMWHRRLPPQLREQFILRSSDQDMSYSLKSAPRESFAVARTGRKENPEALQGFHSDNLLFILDEASGIDEVIFQVASGALSGEHSKVLMTANPTRTYGYFYESHHKMREDWYTMKVSCEDSSRVSPKYIESMARQYGAESNIYRVRVLGEFPISEDDVVIPLDMVEAAVTRDVEPISILPVWGLDVARYGNCRTALAKRCGNVQLEKVKSWGKRDLMEVSGILMAEYEDTPSDELPAEILIDSVGLGAGVLDRCKELSLPVRGINVGETASGRDRYVNMKAELWWRAREWLDAKDCKMCDDARLIAQLSTMKYKFTSSGKIYIESKEDYGKRMAPEDWGSKSPDEADAWVLTFAGGTRRVQRERYSQETRKRGWRRRTAWAR